MPEQPSADEGDAAAPTDMWGWAQEHKRPLPYGVYLDRYGHTYEDTEELVEPSEPDADMIEDAEQGRFRRVVSWIAQIGDNIFRETERISSKRRESIKRSRK